MFSKIMVPLDGSKTAEGALEPAKYLARVGLGEIELLRVQSLPAEFGFPLDCPVSPQVYEAERAHCQQYLDACAENLAKEGFRTQCTVLGGGDPARIIADAAVRSGSELIVLTSHGRSGIRHVLLGSVAEKLARLASCPVMIVGRNTLALAEAQQRQCSAGH